MNKTKKTPREAYSARLQQIIRQVRSGQLLTPQTVKAGISRMLDQEMRF